MLEPIRCGARHSSGDECHRPPDHEGRCYNIVTERHWGEPAKDAPVKHRHMQKTGWFKERAASLDNEPEQWLILLSDGQFVWFPASWWIVVSEIDTDAKAVFSAPKQAVDDTLRRDGLDPEQLVGEFWRRMEKAGFKRIKR